MADFQYQPAQDDSLSKLRTAVASLDGRYSSPSLFPLLSCRTITVEGISAYRLPQETEDYTIDDPSAMDVDIDPQLVGRTQPEAQHSTQRSNLRLFPPPIFSRQGISQNYKYVLPPFPGPSNAWFMFLLRS